MEENSTTPILRKIESFVTQMVSDLRRVDPSYNPCPSAPAPSPAPTPTPTPTTPAPAVKPLSFTVTNKSTVVTSAQIAAAIAGIQAQYVNDYVPAWGGVAPRTFALLFVDQDPSAPGALGYHDLVNDVPTAHILVKTTQQAGVSMSSVLSHEVLEMLGDADINRTILVDTSANQDGTRGTLYMAELCDAVEQDSYVQSGVEVSNFVLPAWFDPSNTKGPFDFKNKLKAALELLPGGSYIGTLDFTSASGWQSMQAEKGGK